VLAGGSYSWFLGLESIRKSPKLLHAGFFSSALGGGLEPHFGVLFSAIFQGVSLGNFHQRGKQWKQNCCKLLQIYVHFLC